MLGCLTWPSYLGENLWASCPPNVSTFSPSFIVIYFNSSFTTSLFLLVVYSCVTSVGTNSHVWAWVQRQCCSCISLLNWTLCVCVWLFYFQAALAWLNDILVLCVIPSKNVVGVEACGAGRSATIPSQPTSVCPSKTRVQFVSSLVNIRLQASLTCAYILMKLWSHLFTRWFTLQSSEALNQRDFKTLSKICKLDETSCLFLLHVVAFGPKLHFNPNSFIRQIQQWLLLH